jgi:hypothetical protein
VAVGGAGVTVAFVTETAGKLQFSNINATKMKGIMRELLRFMDV